MKVSYQWLKEFVDLSFSPNELADLLTNAGLEVENIEESRPNFQKVVVGEITNLQPHPRSERLFLCTVNDGQKIYKVICGAPNTQAGKKVALALPGAILPTTGTIKPVEIQGILSEGMLCSEMELGLSDDAAGIMILEDSLSLGLPLEKALDLNDWILDISVTPNRADCLCILGIAREVAALTKKPLVFPQEDKADVQESLAAQTTVTIERPDLCPRYVAKLILNVQIAPSPFWMRRRLTALGVRAINNIVDVTNYVMLELGQPLHAFDFDLLEEKRIVVRTANPGETFTTLDGVERIMPPEALMICDGRKPVALAGIMGGLNSEVKPETRNILLESAYFDPMGIRRTAKKIGLNTEASLRFERGIDPNGSLKAAERAAFLMAKLAGGVIVKEAVDNYPKRIEPRKISLRVNRVNQILGTSLSAAEVRNYLENLTLQVEAEASDKLKITVPTFRVDLEREIDLIEEVARLYGYHKIPVTLPLGRVGPERKGKAEKLAYKARAVLTACGFFETINYSFLSPQVLQKLNLKAPDPRGQLLLIKNPLSEDQAAMRTTLIPGILQTVRHNFNRQNFNVKLFELGRVFWPRKGEELPEEVEMLAGIISGLREEESWHKAGAECDFYDLKGAVELLMEGLAVKEYNFRPGAKEPFLHPTKSAQIVAEEKLLGVMGELHPDVKDAFDLIQPVYIFEINFSLLPELIAEKRVFQPLPRFPAVFRDLSFMVEEKILAGDLVQTIWEGGQGMVKEVKIFDLYRGKPVPPGKKSLAFRIKYQHAEKTLTDEEVNELHQKIIALMKDRFGGELR